MFSQPTPGGCGARLVVAVQLQRQQQLLMLKLLLLLLLLLPPPTELAAHLAGLPVNLARSELSLDWRGLTGVPVEQLCAAAAAASASVSNSQPERTISPINEVNLAHNRIEVIQTEAFTCLASTLRIINLRHNQIRLITEDAFTALHSLQVLQLDYNLLVAVPSRESLKPLSSLRHLNLANNRIEAIQAEAFGPESGQLISLDLKGNPLRQISGKALLSLGKLQTLILSQSALSGPVSRLAGLTELRFYYLDRASLQVSPPDLCLDSRKLTSLILKSNQLERIPQFAHCQSLLLLDLSYNQIRGSLNESFLVDQPNLIDLYLGHNHIEFVHERAFLGLTSLQVLELNDNHLQQIHPNAFLPIRSTIIDLNLSNNPRLSSLSARGLDQLDSLKAYGNLELRALPHFRSASLLALTYAYHCCDYLEGSERFSSSSSVQLSWSSSLLLELLSSALTKLSGGQWSAREPTGLQTPREDEADLNLTSNNELASQLQLQQLQLQQLQLQQQQQINELVLWPESHRQLQDVEMNVWRTEILGLTGSTTTTDGHHHHHHSSGAAKRNQVRNATRMSGQWQWPSLPEVTPRTRHIRRSYLDEHDQQEEEQRRAHLDELLASSALSPQHLIDEPLLASWRHLNQIRAAHSVRIKPPTGSGQRPRPPDPSRVKQLQRRDANPQATTTTLPQMKPLLERHCLPKPGPFLPCQDLFDTWWLRVGVWSVFLLAFTGNILVIVVLSSVRASSSTSALTSIMWLAHSKRHMDVPRFLVINLAVADLLMAMYLGLLAFVDLTTLGEFKVFAIKWQYSTGCKLAGFLGVLSSELSVFILAVITLERNYAITNAVHLNRRLSLQKAMLIMTFGYLFGLAMAVMPLNGISDYRKFSICLPLDIDSNWSSQLYVITLIAINAFSFLLLLSCYLRMYCAIRGSQAWNTNDLRIARRMSILVITDFLCWMPIIVAALASLFGYHLIGANGIKILTIFILPLNSVANPFLYAITTKKFKRDLETLMRRMRSTRHLNYLCCNHHQGDSKDSKLFSGYNHQYQQNLMMMNKKRHLQLDNLALNANDENHRRSAAAIEQARRRRRQQAARRCLTQQPANNNNNLGAVNRTTCSLQRAYPVAHEPLTQVRSCLLTQPKIVLDGVASMEPSLLTNNDVASGGLIKKSLSTNSAANLLEPRYCLPIGGTPDAFGRHIVTLAASSNGSRRTVNWYPLRPHSTELSANPLDNCQPPVLVENPFSDHHQQSLQKQVQSIHQQQHYLSVYDAPPTDRSASACGYRVQESSKKREEVRVTGSYDTVRMEQNNNHQPGLKLSRSINRLLFGPIAKAWSSIQISLNSSNTQLGAGKQNSSNKHLQHPAQTTAGTASTGKKDLPTHSTTIDDLLLISSPSAHHLGRLSERRMSRSCDVISNNTNLQQQYQNAISLKSPTSSNDATTSHFDYDDDQRILLATINRIAAGGHKSGTTCEEQVSANRGNQYVRNRCTRCRSWSPALLSKLEECIHQFRFKLPSFGGATKNEHQAQHDLSNPSESGEAADMEQQVLDSFDNDCGNCNDHNHADDDREQDSDTYEELEGIDQPQGHSNNNEELDEEGDDEDKFNETCLLEWSSRRKELARRYRFGRQSVNKLQHQSSTTSDTLSTRTGATLLTNVSLSFDSNTGIPVSGQRATTCESADQPQQHSELDKSNH